MTSERSSHVKIGSARSVLVALDDVDDKDCEEVELVGVDACVDVDCRLRGSELAEYLAHND